MIRNLTMGDITFWEGNTPGPQFPREGDWKDCTNAISGEVVIDEIEGIPLVEMTLGKVQLPDPERDTYLLVTRIVAEAAAAQGRTTSDLLIPSRPVKDPSDDNIIVGYRQVQRLPR